MKQLSNWKKEFLANASNAFNGSKNERKAKKEAQEAKKKEEELLNTIGHLTVQVNWLKKNLMNCSDTVGRRNMVSKNDELSITEQCKLLEINRQTLYYTPADKTAKAEEDEYIMQRIDYWHCKHCTFGYRKLLRKLRREDKIDIGKKRLIRLMHKMNICTVYPKPNLSKSDKIALKLPYLLKNLTINRPNQVWAIDITYIKMGRSHMYLTAIIDWYTRFIVGYKLSDTLETVPVLQAVSDAIEKYGKPEIINSDQGSQFTSEEYKTFLKEQGIRQSMDGKSRWADNVMIERWFRSLKCELIYINEFNAPRELRREIGRYVAFYNTERPHESLEYKYPSDIYLKAA